MTIRFFDMFAGIGGFRSGLEAVGDFECVGHCEIDKYANLAYNAIYEPKGELYFEDARTINPNDLPDIDLICAGFPCQSFSVAGKRLGFADDTRGTLFFETARIADVKFHLRTREDNSIYRTEYRTHNRHLLLTEKKRLSGRCFCFFKNSEYHV